MKQLAEMTPEELISLTNYTCTCGHTHRAGLLYLKIGKGAVNSLPEALESIGRKKPFVFCDRYTHDAAMAKVTAVLTEAEIEYSFFMFPQEFVEPDERAVEQLKAAFDKECDVILSVGSGVMTDCGKVLAYGLGIPTVAIATAPSMDGYASNSSSMIQNRVKVTDYNACPQVILADTDILKNAPKRMLQAGLGDMLAKSVALCEWRISHLITGEYYCEEIAGLMRSSLQKIISAAPKLLSRDGDAIEAVTEGLILSGIAMAFAEMSRPASGLEHYFSHLWEMFAIREGKRAELHGIQVGVGTALTLQILERVRGMQPDEQTAKQAAECFDAKAWEQEMRRVFGSAGQTLIEKEYAIWHKNDPAGRMERFRRIQEHWDEILQIMDEELPSAAEIIAMMRELDMPVTPVDIAEGEEAVRDAFIHSRDIRDKYLSSSMLWDMGLLDAFPLPES